MLISELRKRAEQLPQQDGKSEPEILKARLAYARSHMFWSEDEDRLLLDAHYADLSVYEISAMVKRSEKAITMRLHDRFDVEVSASSRAPVIPPKQSIPAKPAIKSQTVSKVESAKAEPTKVKSFLQEKEAVRVLAYWRNSLADTEKMGLDSKKVCEEGESFIFDIIQKGRLPPDRVKRFFDDAEKAVKQKNRQKAKYKHANNSDDEDEVSIKQLQVIITPYTARADYAHGKKINPEKTPDEVFPVWLVASLGRDGVLTPMEESVLPWLDRKCLTPNEDEKCIGYPMIGDVSEVDAFYVEKKSLFEQGAVSWGTLFTFAEELFDSVLNENRDAFAKQHYTLLQKGYVLPISDVIGATKNVLATYDQYIYGKDRALPALLEEFCSLQERTHISSQSQETLYLGSLKHVGQMEKEFPLSESQRNSLSYFFDPDHNQIFTINGPPGTGKTSLILSVIATQWVEAALAKKPPPIMVASATNNQAIINILDSLIQSTRWLPDFNNYGLYLASSSKEKEINSKKYLFRLKEKASGNLEDYYSSGYRSSAKLYFLEQYNRFFEKSETNLEACRKALHVQMQQKKMLLTEVLQFAQQAFSAHKKWLEQYKSMDQLKEAIAQAEQNKMQFELQIEALKRIQSDWLLYKLSQLKWYIIFAWLPFVKNMLADKVRLFTMKHPGVFIDTLACMSAVGVLIEQNMDEQKLACRKESADLQKFEAAEKEYAELVASQRVMEKKLGFEFQLDNLYDFADTGSLLCQLDTTLRHDLFTLATHYWEAEWILQSETRDVLSYDLEGRKKFWQLQAMLTPCMVTTLHSGTAFFQYRTIAQEFETVENFVDLLVIDEAGQAMSALAGAMISTAKRVLLVGDTKQIEPVFTLTAGIDFANTKKFGLCQTSQDYEFLKDKGVLCSGDPSVGHSFGNVIVYAFKQPHLTA